jgi:hypothetical protein
MSVDKTYQQNTDQSLHKGREFGVNVYSADLCHVRDLAEKPIYGSLPPMTMHGFLSVFFPTIIVTKWRTLPAFLDMKESAEGLIISGFVFNLLTAMIRQDVPEHGSSLHRSSVMDHPLRRYAARARCGFDRE